MPGGGTAESSGSQSAPSLSPANSNKRISQLKPSGGLNFDLLDLSQAWKRWSEEITLYMDLAMVGKDEKTNVNLFHYIIGSKGIEIYETLQFEREPNERTLKDVIAAFKEHCNPKKNETVERYKFSTRVQEEGESIEKFVTDLKLLATTCNFGMLQDSLVRDRVICRIRNSTLREELLKSADLDLEKCLRECRVSELSKTK